MLKISEKAHFSVSNAILISGTARSGTTIMGKIIHSFDGIEYSYEPPMLFSLFPLINHLEEQDWRILYETYLYEDFMLNAIAGRAINCNRSDDSSIYNVKSEKEVAFRLQCSLSKNEAEILSKHRTIAYKMPDITIYIPKLIKYYPNMRVVIMVRDAVGTLNSILKKKWFSELNVNNSLIWPFRTYKQIKVPFWVRKKDDELWTKLSELDRAAYYYIRINESINNIIGYTKVKYKQLVNRPKDTIYGLAEKLNLKVGTETEKILQEIKPTAPERDIHILNHIHSNLKEEVFYYSSLSE